MKDADIDLAPPPPARPLRCRSVLLRAVFIADSHQVDQIAHGGLFNYTLLSVRPSIAQLMQSFMRLFRSIPVREMQPGPNPPPRSPYPHPRCPPQGGHRTETLTLVLLRRYAGRSPINTLAKGPVV